MNRESQEPRYVGTNWDKVKVEEKNGACGTTARKVVTRGTHKIDAGELIAQAIARLRQGYEVRFTDGSGADAIRIYPCVARGTNHMEPSLRPMGMFRTSVQDKTVEVRNVAKSGGDRGEGAETSEKDDPKGVTPDIMMTCEVCGHRQRVGRKR